MRHWFNVFLGLLLAASAFADKKASSIPNAYVATDIGPVTQYPPTDDQWDLVFYFDAGAATGDNQLLGAEFAVDKFYITGGNLGGEPNQVYVFDAEGSLLFQFDQWSSPGWGWRDLAYDGTYLYGSDDTVIDAFDLDGNPVPGMNINIGGSGLAYDEISDHFWTQAGGLLVEFDRDGNIIWSGSSGTAGYGLAFDNAAPDGPWLWIFSQSGMPMTTFHQFDPVNHVPTGFIYQLPLLPGSTDQIAGGAFFTEEWDPDYWVLGGITQGTPDDMVFLLEMYPRQFTSIPYDWVEINPTVPGAFPGINTGITGDDQNLGPFPMGMNFPYYDDSTYSSIRVCSNGWLSFNSTATAPSNQPIPSPEYPNNLIAPYWTDLNPSAGGSIWYYPDVANDRFICEFYQVPYIVGPGNHTFEVILYAGGTIDFMYQDLPPGTLNACAVGIENATGTVGILIWYNGSGAISPLPLTGIRVFPVCSPPPVHDVTIDLTYVSGSPVSATGGPINYNVEVANNETDQLTFDAWIGVTPPSMSEIILVQRELIMPGGGSAMRNLTLNVPPGAPPGTYVITGYTGDYPTTVWDQSSFPFSKSGEGDGIFEPSAWTITGWDEPWEIVTTAPVPTEFAVLGNYPNPFNQTTTIRFSLPEATNVTLTVYDINGCQVADLVNGWRDAGMHEVTFDGAYLPSGIYLARITTNYTSQAQKLVLMK